MKNALLLLACFCLLPALPCAAKSRGSVRPATKGASVGALAKDYVFLTEACPVPTGTFGVWETFLLLPAGQYRIKYEDDLGFYLPAPSPIHSVQQNGVQRYVNPQEGGLYIRKDRPAEVHPYRVDQKTSAVIPPNLTAFPLNQKAMKKLRQ